MNSDKIRFRLCEWLGNDRAPSLPPAEGGARNLPAEPGGGGGVVRTAMQRCIPTFLRRVVRRSGWHRNRSGGPHPSLGLTFLSRIWGRGTRPASQRGTAARLPCLRSGRMTHRTLCREMCCCTSRRITAQHETSLPSSLSGEKRTKGQVE